MTAQYSRLLTLQLIPHFFPPTTISKWIDFSRSTLSDVSYSFLSHYSCFLYSTKTRQTHCKWWKFSVLFCFFIVKTSEQMKRRSCRRGINIHTQSTTSTQSIIHGVSSEHGWGKQQEDAWGHVEVQVRPPVSEGWLKKKTNEEFGGSCL